MTIGPLTLLAPASGLVALALALPALLLWYFLKLRRRPVRVSSTFLWAQASADLQVNVPFRWLRASWLLLLQLLILLALVLAVARPTVQGSGGADERLVLLIDRSASMSALDGDVDGSSGPASRLQQAKQQARRLVDALSSGATGMVIAFASRPVALTTLTRDQSLLKAAIDSIEPTDQPGDLEAALRLVSNSAARGQEEDAPAPRVVLISDGAFERLASDGTGGTNLGRARFQFVRAGPPPLEAPDGAPLPQRLDNTGIVALAARRGYEDPSTVSLFFRVQSVLEAPTDLAVTIRLDDQLLEARAVRVAPSADGPGDEAQRVEFQNTRGGLVTISIGRRDLLASDNQAGLVLPPPQAPAILLVQPDVPEAVLDFLPFDVLQSLEPRTLDTMTAAQYERTAASPQGPALIGGFSLIVFDRVRPASLPTIPSLSFGAAPPIPGLSASRPGPNDPAGRPTSFAFWQRSHPLLRYVNLGSVQVGAPLKLSVPSESGAAGGSDALAASASFEVLASGSAGPLIVLCERAGVRHVVVGFELADSRWWQDPGFPVFIKNAVDLLTLSGEAQAGRAITPTQTVSLRPLPEALEVVVQGPLSLARARDADGWKGPISVGPMERTGLYSVSGVVPDDATLAVSMLDPFESQIRTAPSVILGGQSVAASTQGTGGVREVWHWFVALAAALLTLEWCLYASRMRV